VNEFEWQRQLRDLRQAQAPRRDLWPAIDAALDRAEAAPPWSGLFRRQGLTIAALAASLLLVAGLAWHRSIAPTAPPASVAAHSNWKPADPRLAGAAIELDAARLELELAIEQAPDSQALQRLLRHTEQQQAQLRRLAERAS
jgi:hypothetical protein